jgi:hypothetical protein
MNRREFVAAGLSGLLSYTSTCTSHVRGQPLSGCRTAGAGDAAFRSGVRHLKPARDASDLWPEGTAKNYLSVKAALCEYDDGSAPNGLATPEVLFEGYPDGTVLIGAHLRAELRAKHWDLHTKDLSEYWEATEDVTWLVVAHEYGHILQYKNGMSPDGPWQMEPHADFMAGWWRGHGHATAGAGKPISNVDREATQMFEMGDTLFNDPRHHGTPQFRAHMVRAGFAAGLAGLSVDAAFEKGKKMAGLA